MRGSSDEELHPRIDELVDDVLRVDPDLVFLTGDLIWGSIEAPLADRDRVVRQWDRLDERLDRIDAPIHRVPGNHDIHDPVTRDVFFERYGELPRTVKRHGARFFLLNSSYTPDGDDPVPIRGKPGKATRLSTAQIDFVRAELERETFEHDFLVMHHVLWFYPDDVWWTEVHPLLVEHGVNAVFAGDVGPGGMFTHATRDGVEYYRSTVNAMVDRAVPEGATSRFIRTVQLETFLEANVRGDDVDYRVHALFGETSDAFEPARWHEVFGPEREPARYFDPDTYRRPGGANRQRAEPGLVSRGLAEVGSPKRLAALAVFGGMWLALGIVIGRRARAAAGR